MDVKILKNKNVNYEIWFLEGLLWVNLLLLSLQHPFLPALLLRGLFSCAAKEKMGLCWLLKVIPGMQHWGHAGGTGLHRAMPQIRAEAGIEPGAK